jgi:hypothetical protein
MFCQGNVNVAHYLPFLGAEEAAMKGNSGDAIRLYGQAITSASRSGFQHNAAFASERLGEYLLYDIQDSKRAGTYLRDAVTLYSDWGSDYKSKLVRKKHSHLWDKIPSDIEVSISP